MRYRGLFDEPGWSILYRRRLDDNILIIGIDEAFI